MSRETQYEGPSNIVGFNRYIYDSKQRVMTALVREQEWYTARAIDPTAASIDQYAYDVLIRVMKIVELKDGAIRLYAVAVGKDGVEEINEEDSVAMSDGYFVEKGKQRGYLLPFFKKGPKSLGTLAAEALVAA